LGNVSPEGLAACAGRSRELQVKLILARGGRGRLSPIQLELAQVPDRDGGSFLTFGDDLEQQFGAARVDLDVAEFVEEQASWPGGAAATSTSTIALSVGVSRSTRQ
jgi:hypothetical protein